MPCPGSVYVTRASPSSLAQADVSKQITKLPPPDEPIRPHGCALERLPLRTFLVPLPPLTGATRTTLHCRKKMVIKKGCDCGWCEAVSWDVVGELRDTIEKLQQSLMMRGTHMHARCHCVRPIVSGRHHHTSRCLRAPVSRALQWHELGIVSAASSSSPCTDARLTAFRRG